MTFRDPDDDFNAVNPAGDLEDGRDDCRPCCVMAVDGTGRWRTIATGPAWFACDLVHTAARTGPARVYVIDTGELLYEWRPGMLR